MMVMRSRVSTAQQALREAIWERTDQDVYVPERLEPLDHKVKDLETAELTFDAGSVRALALARRGADALHGVLALGHEAASDDARQAGIVGEGTPVLDGPPVPDDRAVAALEDLRDGRGRDALAGQVPDDLLAVFDAKRGCAFRP